MNQSHMLSELCLRYPEPMQYAQITYEQAVGLLLRAMQIATQTPFVWGHIDRPNDGNTFIVYMVPQQTAFPNDGIRFQEQEQRISMAAGAGRELEVNECKYGFIPDSSDTAAFRIRRRFRLIKGGVHQLMLVHYSRGQPIAINPSLASQPVRQYPLRPVNEPAMYVLGEKMGQKVYPGQQQQQQQQQLQQLQQQQQHQQQLQAQQGMMGGGVGVGGGGVGGGGAGIPMSPGGNVQPGGAMPIGGLGMPGGLGGGLPAGVGVGVGVGGMPVGVGVGGGGGMGGMPNAPMPNLGSIPGNSNMPNLSSLHPGAVGPGPGPGPGAVLNHQSLLAQQAREMEVLEQRRQAALAAQAQQQAAIQQQQAAAMQHQHQQAMQHQQAVAARERGGAGAARVDEDDSGDEVDQISTQALALARYKRNHDYMNEVFMHAAFGEKRPETTPRAGAYSSCFDRADVEAKAAKLAMEVEALRARAVEREEARARRIREDEERRVGGGGGGDEDGDVSMNNSLWSTGDV